MKRTHLSCFLAVFGGLLIGTTQLWAQSTLDVKCVDGSGNAVSNARVFLQHLSAGKTRDKKSDGKGATTFDKLDDGVYRVVGRKEGFEPAFFEFISLKGSAKQSVTLQFKPGDPQKQLYFESQATHQKASELLSQGVQSLQANKFLEAEKQLRESVEANPSNPDAHFNLAIALLQQQKWQPAEESLKKAAELATLFMQFPQQTAGENPYKELKQRVDMVLSKINSLKIRAEADKALQEKRFEDAIAKYREELKTDKDPELLQNLAVALAQTRKYDEAVAALDQAIQLKPQEASYQSLKKQILDFKQNEVLILAQRVLDEGNKLFDSGDHPGALKKYEEVLARIPEQNQASVWFQIGRTQAQLSQAEKAIAAYKKAMALAPDKPDYRKALAQYYLDQKRYEEALNLYAEQGGGSSESPDQAVFALAQKLSTQGNSEVAQVAFEKVLTINPQHAEAHYELGMGLYYAKKNDKRSSDLLTKYLEIGKQKDHLDNAKTVLIVLKKRMSAPPKK
jgi:tetratricopeptide (TPR) repeat protein